MTGEPDKLQAARRRRAHGTVLDFDGQRLALARRLKRKQRTVLARDAGVTAKAISQFEKGQSRPTTPVLAQMALALGVSVEFFRRGRPIEVVPAAAAHFRSLRSTPAIVRDQALAFAEISLAVVDLVEQYVDLPSVNLPSLELQDNPQSTTDCGGCRRNTSVFWGSRTVPSRTLSASLRPAAWLWYECRATSIGTSTPFQQTLASDRSSCCRRSRTIRRGVGWMAVMNLVTW